MPAFDVIDQDEKEMKSQKSYRTVEEVSDGDGRESDGVPEMNIIDQEREDDAKRD